MKVFIKRGALAAVLFLMCAATYAQQTFPLSAKQDKEGIMNKAYWELWNPKVQARIDRDIEQNRKADATVVLPDVKSGSSVKVEQVTSDFIFGAHIFNFNQLGSKERNDKYKNLYGTLFNRATVGFYWRAFETRPGRRRFITEDWDTEAWWNKQENPNAQPHWRRPSTDQIVDFLIQKGVAIHGHPMIWSNTHWHQPAWLYRYLNADEKKEMDKLVARYPDTYDLLSEPQYTKAYHDISTAEVNQKFEEYGKKLNKIYEERIRGLIEHYGNKIGSWDVVNESASDYAHGLMKTGDLLMKTGSIMPGDYTFKAFKTAENCFPQGVWKNINDYWTGPEYARQVKDLLSRGAKIDIVGTQMHLFKPQMCQDIADGKDTRTQSPEHIWNLMKDLASAGLPLCLSEITITSPSTDHRGQMIQAIITQNLYRIWFSIKEMKAITWWNVVDGCGAPGEPAVSGLFTRDMQPKLSYYALNDLINNQWKTRLDVKAKNGKVKFRGFRGRYHITYTTEDGRTRSVDYHVE